MKKILYASGSDPTDIEVWAGSNHHIYFALKNVFPVVEAFGPLAKPVSFVNRAQMSLTERLTKKHLIWSHRVDDAKRMGRLIDQKVAEGTYDAIFAPSTSAVSYVTADVPVFAYHDATIKGLIEHYGSSERVFGPSLREAMRVEAKALARCDRMFYTSEWACDCAIQDYGLSPDKVCFVPFGANLPSSHALNLEQAISARSRQVIKLLFLGKDWERKGGDVAVGVAQALIGMGIQTELHLLGTELPARHADKLFIVQHGYISKSTPKGLAMIQDLIVSCHFLLLPTRAECYGLVFCEASAFGVPSIATKTGGVTSAIKDGVNGFTFSLDTPPRIYADKIYELFMDNEKYKALAESSFARYKSELNWKSCAAHLKQEMTLAAEQRKRKS